MLEQERSQLKLLLKQKDTELKDVNEQIGQLNTESYDYKMQTEQQIK